MLKGLWILILLVMPAAIHATHLRGGQIRIVSSNGLSCTIELRLMTNTASDVMAGGGVLDFGDRTSFTTPAKASTIVTGQPDLGVVVYAIDHTYAAPGRYMVSYSEPNLTAGILNMTNSGETKFFVASGINVDGESFVSPNFPTDPIFVWPLHRDYSFSTAAIDDSPTNDFFYKYSIPLFNIDGYEIPGNLQVDPDNGIITWDTKFHGQYVAGLYWIAVIITKYSKSGRYVSDVMRGIQLIVEDNGSRIGLTSSLTSSGNKVTVPDGQEKKIKLVLTDNTSVDSLYFDVYYNKTIQKNISVEHYDSVSSDQKFRVVDLSFKTSSDMVTDLPYPVTLRGHSDYLKDITFLYMTKDIDLPKLPGVVAGVEVQPEMKIYPNPFQSELYIDSSDPVNITMINTLGQVVMRSTTIQGQPVDTSGLPSGIYILRVRGKDGKFVLNYTIACRRY